MLYKNDEPYRLGKPEIDKLIERFHGKFPVKVAYPDARIIPSKLKHNKLPDKPNSISFDLKSTVKTDNGSEIWRYAENVVVDNKGVKRYTPKKFLFNGARFLDRNDIELIYFLEKKSHHKYLSDEEMKDGKLPQSRQPKFMFEDLVSDAEKKARKRAQEAKISSLLYGDYALPEEKLRLLAKAYHVKNVDTLTFPQVKIILDTEIHKDKHGASKFFDMANADDEINIRVSLQKAIDMGILRLDLTKKAWFWVTKEGKDVKACTIPANKNANEALYDTYNGDEGFRDDLKASLLTKKPNVGKKIKEEPGEPEE